MDRILEEERRRASSVESNGHDRAPAPPPAGVAADPFDARDRIFVAGLRPLGRSLHPDRLLVSGRADARDRLRITVRRQGGEGTCTGQALAAVIDILRLPLYPAPDTVPPASARMLFEMARSHAPDPSGRGEVHSLRAALKGFYHNGACLDEHWPYRPGADPGMLNVARAKAARGIGLGAYCRVRPLLDDMHAALSETGAVYVAAATHDGWESEAVVANDGRIVPGTREGDLHAFVLVGYDDQGFLVLNSWGPGWGGYRGLPGIAHWPYADWADSIRDAWVLRLAVPAPEAFDLAKFEQGLVFPGGGPIARASIPRADVVGHYAQLDDGDHVGRGSYPSSRASVRETADYLVRPQDSGGTGPPYRHLLLRFAGGIGDLDAAIANVSAWKMPAKRRGIYPFSLLCCPGTLTDLESAVQDGLARASQRAAEPGDEYDRLVEDGAARLCRAFRCDLRHAAATAAAPDGAIRHCVEALLAAGSGYAPPFRLHLVAEELGVLFLAGLLDALKADQAQEARLFESIDSVQLVAPACSADDLDRSFGRLIQALAARRPDAAVPPDQAAPPVVIRVPSRRIASRLRVKDYQGSLLTLLCRAGASGTGDWLGAGDAASARRAVRQAFHGRPAPCVERIQDPPEGSAARDLAAVLRTRALREAVLETAVPDRERLAQAVTRPAPAGPGADH